MRTLDDFRGPDNGIAVWLQRRGGDRLTESGIEDYLRRSTWQMPRSAHIRFVPAWLLQASTAAPSVKRWKRPRISIALAATPAAKVARNSVSKEKAAVRFYLDRGFAQSCFRAIAPICGNASRSPHTGRAAFPKTGRRNRTARSGAIDELRRIRKKGTRVWPSLRQACSPPSLLYLSLEPPPRTFRPPVGSCDRPLAIPRRQPPPRTCCRC